LIEFDDFDELASTVLIGVTPSEILNATDLELTYLSDRLPYAESQVYARLKCLIFVEVFFLTMSFAKPKLKDNSSLGATLVLLSFFLISVLSFSFSDCSLTDVKIIELFHLYASLGCLSSILMNSG